VAVDWWNGNRVPYADKGLRGLIAGFDLSTGAIDIYRALMDSVCFGARSIVDRFRDGGVPVNRVVLTSGLAKSNPFLLRITADVLGQTMYVPDLENATCVGAAIHGAVAAGVVTGFRDGAQRFGARRFDAYRPDAAREAAYRKVYGEYCSLSGDEAFRTSVRNLGSAASGLEPA
jgi:L-ribulokinase